MMHFFHRTGTIVNKSLSRESREAINETNAFEPVKKDQIEDKLWTSDLDSVESKTAYNVIF